MRHRLASVMRIAVAAALLLLRAKGKLARDILDQPGKTVVMDYKRNVIQLLKMERVYIAVIPMGTIEPVSVAGRLCGVLNVQKMQLVQMV